tara:strand:+ start:188 stop:472 length:285 start_codon:yes stop_codon:yes gene_type:complete
MSVEQHKDKSRKELFEILQIQAEEFKNLEYINKVNCSKLDVAAKSCGALQDKVAELESICQQADDITTNCTITDETVVERLLELFDNHRDFYGR